jgi:hypothetical protein
MSGFSPEDTMAMERLHIVDGEQRVARQEMLVRRISTKENSQLAHGAIDLLKSMRVSLQLSRDRLRDLEYRYHNTPRS